MTSHLRLPVISAALEDAGWRLDQIDAIAATAGPGLIGAVLTELVCEGDLPEVETGTTGEYMAIDRRRMPQRWKAEALSASESGVKGLREVIFEISGQGAYSRLKYEGGVHRVQRVPETESQGRIHTSACTVAILPEADAIDGVEINNSDLRIDTYRASGAGGQHVNTTDSAMVRKFQVGSDILDLNIAVPGILEVGGDNAALILAGQRLFTDNRRLLEARRRAGQLRKKAA